MIVGPECGHIPSTIIETSDTLTVRKLDVDAELSELLVEKLHELGSIDSFRETGIVLDFTGICRKTSDERLLHEKCLKPCTARIEGSRHSTGTTADDDDIIIFNSLFHISLLEKKRMAPPVMKGATIL